MLLLRTLGILVTSIAMAILNPSFADAADPPPDCPFQVVGHRGTDVGVKRNNTIEAFQRAINDGADVIELDIRKTKATKRNPAVWVINHNSRIRGKKISRTTYKKLKRLRPTLPTLDQAAAVISKGQIGIEVEFKPSRVSKSNIRHVLRILDKYKLRRVAVISSSHKSLLRKIRPLAGATNLAYIAWKPQKLDEVTKFANIINLNRSSVSSSYVIAAHARNLKVEGWPGNDAAGWALMAGFKVDAITTDKSAALVAWCAQQYAA